MGDLDWMTWQNSVLRGALLGPAYSILKLFFDFPDPYPNLDLFALTGANFFVVGVTTLIYCLGGSLLGLIYYYAMQIPE